MSEESTVIQFRCISELERIFHQMKNDEALAYLVEKGSGGEITELDLPTFHSLLEPLTTISTRYTIADVPRSLASKEITAIPHVIGTVFLQLSDTPSLSIGARYRFVAT